MSLLQNAMLMRNDRVASAPVLLAMGAIGFALLFSLPGRGRPGLLGPGADTYPAELRALVEAAQASPGDADAAVLAAERLIREGRAESDANAVEAAYTLLEPFLGEGAPSEALTQAAIARQYLHEFGAALELLNRALAANPHDLEALLTRANIRLVRGELDAAAADCRRLAAEGRFDLAILCDTTAKALGAGAPEAYKRLATLLKLGRMDPNLRGYAFSVLGEIAIFQNWPERARANFRKARQLDPDNLRIRMLQADALLNADAPREALAALDGAPASDAILLRRAIACKRLGREEALAAASAELERRFERNIRMGSAAHAREGARYFLQVAGKPDLALARAKANWGKQREYEDAWLLIEAAEAAGEPAAADAVEAWMDDQAVTAPALVSRLNGPTAS